MSSHFAIPEKLSHYVLDHTRQSDVARRLWELTDKHPRRSMLTTPDQGAFLAMLVRLINAKNILEIGTFTGYSALSMAQALPADGKLIACDTSTEFTSIGKPFWEEAGVASRIDLRIAPALKTLPTLTAGHFDLAFIDADKENYDAYYEACLKLVRQGGAIVFDNMLWRGAVADPTDQESITKAIRALNAKIHSDSRVEASLLTVSDGMMLVQKR